MNIFMRIRTWITSKFILSVDILVPCSKAVTHGVDERTMETVKRVRKSFKEQESAMNSRAMKAHDPKCEDLASCKKRKCFKFEPDKIVSDPYEVKGR